MADIIHTPEVDQEKKALKDAYSQHLTDLDVIINNIVGVNLAQTQEAIKTLAQGQKRMLKLIKKRLT